MLVKSIRDVRHLRGKRVFLRSDFNVPIKNGEIEDDYKIKKQLLTIQFLLKQGARVIICTHLGRPLPGKPVHSYSTKPIAVRLCGLLKKEIGYVNDTCGLKASTAVGKLQDGEALMLENIRFEKGETRDSKILAKQLAKLADIYVNNAFAVSHRPHASINRIKNYLPSYGGFFLEEEIRHLKKIYYPKKPFVVVVGGAKIKTKLPLLKILGKRANQILVGGAIANNFFKARNFEVGKSLVDAPGIKTAKQIKNLNIILPVDVAVSTKSSGGRAEIRNTTQVKKNDYIFDIGPKTIRLYAGILKKANTIVWNGPMGFYELRDFKHGTMSIARIIASRSRGKAFGVAGGGETVDALKKTKMADSMDWISTGGGAMLAFLGGEPMPGLKGLVKGY